MKKKVIITLASMAAVGTAVASYLRYANSRAFYHGCFR